MPLILILSLFVSGGIRGAQNTFPSRDTCFLICLFRSYARVNKNLELKWLPEVRQNCPTAAYLIIGTQIDLRDDEKVRQKLQKRRMKPITTEEGARFAKKMNADCYVECSSLTNIDSVFVCFRRNTRGSEYFPIQGHMFSYLLIP